MGNSLTLSYKVKHILTLWSNNPTFEVFTQEQMWPYAHTTNEIQKAFFIIRTNWNKPNSYQLIIDFKIYYAILLCTKKKWDISICNMDESQKTLRSQTQKTIYCIMPFIWNSRKTKTTMTESRSEGAKS